MEATVHYTKNTLSKNVVPLSLCHCNHPANRFKLTWSIYLNRALIYLIFDEYVTICTNDNQREAIKESTAKLY